MSYTKTKLLDEAIAIAKEHAKSGNTYSVEIVLEKVFNKLIELNDRTKEE